MKSCVLFVADELTVGTALTEMFLGTQFEALAATKTGEALRLLRQSGPKISVLITDVKMPGILDG
jgi:CheY-like chemotaxis protein